MGLEKTSPLAKTAKVEEIKMRIKPIRIKVDGRSKLMVPIGTPCAKCQKSIWGPWKTDTDGAVIHTECPRRRRTLV